jgi:hypothetical protein
MNDRLRLPLSLALTACALAPALAEPEAAAAAAPRCPACVIAAPELIDLAGAAVIGATAGAVIDRASQAVEESTAVRTGARVARHPNAYRGVIRWAKGNARSGRAVWKAFKGKPVRIYRWLRRSYSLRKLRKRLPRAAIACVISGTVTGLRTGKIDQAGWSCLGGALGALGSP